MGFVGTKPTISSNVVVADAGTIGSASDEDAIAIAADGSVTFSQDIELGHASDTTIARASAGQITVEGAAVLLAGAQTGITTILNASTKIGRDSDNLIDFATTDNKLIFRVEGVNEVELVQNALSPVTSDGVALGTGSLMWSDVFIADGGVINFNNGDVLLTQSSNLITLTGGGLVVGVDDTGHDVKFFGATAGKYMEWDESADQLDVTGSFDVTGNSSMVGTLTVGVNDTGHDVKFFGASSGAYMEWDESADQLRIMGASADATTSTGKLLLATSLTDINANDVIGKIEFQAPHEAGGTDAITVAAGIEAVAQGTFSASVNATDILFKTGHSEAATEKFRFTSQGEIGIGGTNYGTSGQILTSGGAGAAPSWADAAAGGGTVDLVADGSISAGDRIAITPAGKAKTIAALQTGVNNSSSFDSIVSNGMDEFAAGAYDPDENRFVFVYKDGGNSSYGTAQVFDVDSNGDFSNGSEVVYSSSTSFYNHIVYDTNVNRMLVVYEESNQMKAKVATVDGSDNSISFGSQQSLASDNPNTTELVFDPDTNRVIFIYGSATDTAIYAHVVTITGGGTNTIAVGSECTISTDDHSYSATGYGIVATYDTAADRVLVVWADAGDSKKLTSVVGTVTGASTNTIAFGSEVHVTETSTDSDSSLHPALEFDSSSGKCVYFAFNHTQKKTEMYVGTITGSSTNTCAWGDPTTIISGASGGGYEKSLLSIGDGNIVYGLEDTTSGSAIVRMGVGYVSGTTFVSKFLAASYGVNSMQGKAEIFKGGTGNKIVMMGEVGTALHGIVPDLPDNAGAFIGIANSAISDTATGTINTVGSVGTNQSSLSVGAEYYLTAAGALSSSATDFARIGKALTTSTILIGGIAADAS